MNKGVAALGVIILLVGVFCLAFYTTESAAWGLIKRTTHPLEPFGLPLLVLGLIVALIGAVMPSKKEK
ncbi:MAG: hypothetical protein DRN92_07245 [Thermoproteota archaeon]|nr:MAG: hypothetical protein DRN92_07245 [Candidatus Korarchaeota archaeon]